MTKKHTQGKWEITGKTECINQISIGIRNKSGIDPIGCAYGKGVEAEANARLMAASPELLSAVKDCESYARSMSIFQNSDEGAELARRCHEVIIKVGGQENDN